MRANRSLEFILNYGERKIARGDHARLRIISHQQFLLGVFKPVLAKFEVKLKLHNTILIDIFNKINR